MTLEELALALNVLESGAGIANDVYADLFPPGEPDDDARRRCREFARIPGCSIDNTFAPGTHAVWFLKD